MPLEEARAALKALHDESRKRSLGERLPEGKRPKGMLLIFDEEPTECEQEDEDETEEG